MEAFVLGVHITQYARFSASSQYLLLPSVYWCYSLKYLSFLHRTPPEVDRLEDEGYLTSRVYNDSVHINPCTANALKRPRQLFDYLNEKVEFRTSAQPVKSGEALWSECVCSGCSDDYLSHMPGWIQTFGTVTPSAGWLLAKKSFMPLKSHVWPNDSFDRRYWLVTAGE